MPADNWVSAIGAENWFLCHWVEFSTVAAAVKFFGSRPAKMNWDLKHHVMCRTLGGHVSIVWLWKTFKNCVSLLVSKNRSQKLINAFVPEQRSRLCICIVWFYICIRVVYNIYFSLSVTLSLHLNFKNLSNFYICL